MKVVSKMLFSAMCRRIAVLTLAAEKRQPLGQAVENLDRGTKALQCLRCGLAMIVGSLALLLGGKADATYNANLTGTIVSLATYDNGEILVILSNQPSSNGSCSATFFELDPPAINGSTVVNDAAFDRMYARLAQAYAADQSVNLGFDNAGNCAAGGYIRVYRVG